MQETPKLAPERWMSTSHTTAGISMLLTGLAAGLALLALWIIDNAYEQFYGPGHLDPAMWFAMNMELTEKVLPLAVAGGLCLLISGGMFISWSRRAGWVMHVAFVLLWLVSGILVGLVVLSRYILIGPDR